MPDERHAACLICSATTLEIDGFESLLRVTSDSRIWTAGGRLSQCRFCGAVQKPFDAALSSEVAEIYAGYRLYFQGQGGEQKVFKQGRGRARSDVLLEHLFTSLEEDGSAPKSWLDIGCGTGHLLRGLAALRPEWRLFGADIGERHRAAIEAIDGVHGYFARGTDELHETFDFLSISHVLEHVPTPLAFLRGIGDRLRPGGHVLIAVPNWRENPFDLLVADHCLHFTADRLGALVREAGFEVISLSQTVIPKELTLIARRDGERPVTPAVDRPTAERDADLLRATLDWLRAVIAWADAQDGGRDIGLLGTALAATWLDRSSAQNFAFFVDEDPQRAGGRYLERPVLTPAEVPADASVLLPMPSEVAAAVSTRLNRSGHARFLPTPPLKLAYDSPHH